MRIAAKQLAERMFANKKYGDKPYIYHLQWVADKFPNSDTMQTIAWLHDILEDTEVDYNGISSMFGDFIYYAVVQLTRNSETYADYIDNICHSKNLSAMRVKEADLMCHIKHPSTISESMVRKYEKALRQIQQCISVTMPRVEIKLITANDGAITVQYIEENEVTSLDEVGIIKKDGLIFTETCNGQDMQHSVLAAVGVVIKGYTG